jgi:hypothetical protein
MNEQQSMVFGKKELPGRFLEFDFDFSSFSLSNSRHSSPTSGNKKQTNSVNNSVKQQHQQYYDQNYETGFLSLLANNKTSTLNNEESPKRMNSNWKKSYMSKSKNYHL